WPARFPGPTPGSCVPPSAAGFRRLSRFPRTGNPWSSPDIDPLLGARRIAAGPGVSRRSALDVPPGRPHPDCDTPQHSPHHGEERVMQQTLILLKPDAVQRRLVAEITGRFERKGLR